MKPFLPALAREKPASKPHAAAGFGSQSKAGEGQTRCHPLRRRGVGVAPDPIFGNYIGWFLGGHVLLWRTLSTQVYARAASRVWSAYRPLRSFVISSTRSRLATLPAPKVFALNFTPAKIGTNMSSPPGLYLRSSRLLTQRTF